MNPVEAAAYEFVRRGWGVNGDTRYCIAHKESVPRRGRILQARVEISQLGGYQVRFRVVNKRWFPPDLWWDYRRTVKKADRAARKAMGR